MRAGDPSPTTRRVLIVTSVVFLALVVAALLLGVLPVDAAVREALLALATPWVVAVMRVVNYAGAWPVLLPGMVLLFVVYRQARERWWIWVVLMAVAGLAEWTLKKVIGRARPEDLSLGFPSGHSTAAAAFFGAIIYLSAPLPPAARRAVRALAVLGIVLVALARVLLRAHWPSDALAGVALGLALASAAALVATRPGPGTRPG